MNDPLSLHRYLYANCDTLNRKDAGGQFSIQESLGSIANIISIGASNAARLIPALHFVANKFAFWFLVNATTIAFYAELGAIATAFIEDSARLLLNNDESVEMEGNNPGAWVEKKVSANATDYELIDDNRDGMITSLKTNQQDTNRLINAIRKEAETLGNRVADIQPRNGAPASVKPIPMSSVTHRSVIFVIPEESAEVLRDSGLVTAIRQIQAANRVLVRVIPLRGWRK